MAPCSHLHAQVQTPVSQMEKLDRGLVALPAQDKGIFLSWRLLGTDSKNVCFDIERDGKIIAHQVKLTNYTDRKGSAASSYRIITYQKEPRMDAPAEREVSKAVKPWNDLYRSLPINRPAGGVTPDGKSYEYTPNDCSVGDVNGDGEYEIILKWDPTNAHDNSHDGYTGEVIFDCYKLAIDPELSPRMDLVKDSELLGDMMFSNQSIDSLSDAKPDVLMPLEENPRVKQICERCGYG